VAEFRHFMLTRFNGGIYDPKTEPDPADRSNIRRKRNFGPKTRGGRGVQSGLKAKGSEGSIGDRLETGRYEPWWNRKDEGSKTL